MKFSIDDFGISDSLGSTINVNFNQSAQQHGLLP